MLRIGRVMVAIGMTAAGAALPASAGAGTPSLEALLQPPSLRDAQLSPDGRQLALIAGGGEERLLIMNVADRSVRPVFKAPKGANLAWVRWKGEDRLVASVHAIPAAGPTADPNAAAYDAIYAIPLGGGAPLELVGPTANTEAQLSDPLAWDPRHVMVTAPGRGGKPSLWKIDVGTGGAFFVRTDRGEDAGLPRGAMVVRYAAGATVAPLDPEVQLLGPAPGGDRAYAAVAPKTAADGDTTTVRIYDFTSGKMGRPAWPALRYDVQDIVYRAPDQTLAGVCYVADAYSCDFADAALRADYLHAVRILGGDVNVAPVSMSDDGRAWLLSVSGPREPGAYYVFDRTARTLVRAADRFPGLAGAALAAMEPVAVRSRDGVTIPAYLTRPAGGAGSKPLVVMPHGGPEVRDALGYDRWAQALAAHGYLVLQVNFRGSSGYGRAWSEAGYRQWGGRMQDDLTDAVKAVVASGEADPERICILGASYGGYAALYGGARQPDLYRCAVSIAGVSDLNALLAHEKAKGVDSPEYDYAKRVDGDPEGEAEKLARTSPITYAAVYPRPVLLLHGGRDRQVPIAQSRAMAEALRAAGKPVRLIEVAEEGHGDWSPEREAEALRTILAFLRDAIGGSPGIGEVAMRSTEATPTS